MLFPFRGYLPRQSVPERSTTLATRSRRIREDARRYQSALVLDRAIASGTLTRTRGPRYFAYTMKRGGVTIVRGLVGEVDIDHLLPHEETRDTLIDPPPPIEIRPILLVTRLSMPALRGGSRAGAAAEDGTWMHRIRPVDLPEGFDDTTAMIIADGHHRTRAVRSARGDTARILAMVVGDGGRGLRVGTFHRVFTGVGRLPRGIGDAFEVTPTESRGPIAGSIIWVGGDGARWRLRPTPEGLARVPSALEGSGAALAAAALYPILGVAETDAIYVASTASAVSHLGAGDAALLLPPVPMETVLSAAEAGIPLPPKGTRFDPKPVRGLVLRAAD
ncbi:MAG TPA: hypothetical protein VMM81_05390 [Acidimicrobiia bacterium]|nr:hypothetical protein [Acidimicrobiia bacterium]